MFCSRKSPAVMILAVVAGMSTWLGGCGSAAHDDDAVHPDLHATPSHLRWTVFQGVSVPVGDEGPKRIDGPVAEGYDQSPAGAALAAIESSVRVGVADDSQRAQVGQRLLAPGPGRDRWATARWQLSISQPVDPDAAPRVLGYTITSYSPQKAGIDVYTRQVDGSITRTSTTVIRRDDNWLLEFSDHPGRPVVAAVPATPHDLVALPQSGRGEGR